MDVQPVAGGDFLRDALHREPERFASRVSVLPEGNDLFLFKGTLAFASTCPRVVACALVPFVALLL